MAPRWHVHARRIRLARLTPLALLLSLGGATTSGATPPVLAPSGRYRLDRDASDDVGRALEAVVRRMSVFVRPIARSRLRGANPVYDHITIALAPSSVSTQFDAHAPIVSPADGAPVRWTRENGDVFVLTTRLTAGRLVQTFAGRDGGRENVYALASDGRTLVVGVTITNPRLPEPFVYHLVYRRE